MGTPNPSQMNPATGTRFGGGLDLHHKEPKYTLNHLYNF